MSREEEDGLRCATCSFSYTSGGTLDETKTSRFLASLFLKGGLRGQHCPAHPVHSSQVYSERTCSITENFSGWFDIFFTTLACLQGFVTTNSGQTNTSVSILFLAEKPAGFSAVPDFSSSTT